MDIARAITLPERVHSPAAPSVRANRVSVLPLPVSIIILTRNEEHDLPRCLKSLDWCDDVHVLDSGSTDNTVAIAQAHGAAVHVNRFESFGRQRNWALDHCQARHPWVLFLDADEVATVEFREAVEQAIADAPPDCAGYYCCWKLMFCGQWLRRCDSFPKWQFRLLRTGRARFTDFGHGQKEAAVNGDIGYLRTPYLHYALSKGFRQWVTRHNQYSDLEATARLQARINWKAMFSRHASQRNPALKPLVSRLPAWPVWRFCWMYLAKRGFLEGRPGLIYCAGIAFYEFLIRAKMYELNAQTDAEQNPTR
ncbi:MAG: glycosyltransferase family 2 protein [Akkermansiaceae bacterium]|nr:glycosyltransferase family 2 protein [Verrucomicrobiales bacterium]